MFICILHQLHRILKFSQYGTNNKENTKFLCKIFGTSETDQYSREWKVCEVRQLRLEKISIYIIIITGCKYFCFSKLGLSSNENIVVHMKNESYGINLLKSTPYSSSNHVFPNLNCKFDVSIYYVDISYHFAFACITPFTHERCQFF